MANILPMPGSVSAPDARQAAGISDALLRKRLRNSQLMAALLLIPGLPIIALCVIAVRLTSKGSAIYSQERVGLDGQVFTIYKVRSMTVNAEAGTGAVWAQAGDPRVTFVGRILRFTHLDELPQLFNILKGDMCINGPRPERPEFVSELAGKIPRYTERLMLHPGVTGLAQVRAPADSDLQTVRNKLTLDLAYVRNLDKPAFDFRILCATVLKMAGVPRTMAASMFGLNSIQPVSIEATAAKQTRKAA
jgi:lipopolysaccharide/colanic/teichoic acid biosynthesis glycosyltransferase